MILIADSGSTKTDWRLIDEQNKIHQYATQGFNPYFQTTEEIAEIIKAELLPKLESEISNPKFQIFFLRCRLRSRFKKRNYSKCII